MSKSKQTEDYELQQSADTELVAMVYKNELDEVSYHVGDSAPVSEVDNGLSSVLLVLVMSFVALVTISRRKASF